MKPMVGKERNSRPQNAPASPARVARAGIRRRFQHTIERDGSASAAKAQTPVSGYLTGYLAGYSLRSRISYPGRYLIRAEAFGPPTETDLYFTGTATISTLAARPA